MKTVVKGALVAVTAVNADDTDRLELVEGLEDEINVKQEVDVLY